MELKLVPKKRVILFSAVLIAPNGIETYNNLSQIHNLVVLIAPNGIETMYRDARKAPRCVLIAPNGIETLLPSLRANTGLCINRTQWN